MTHIEAMKQALEALEKCKAALAEELSAWDIDPPLHHVQESHDLCDPAIKSLRQAITTEESTQEPVMIIGENESMMCRTLPTGTKIYLHPQPKAEQEPKREPLTDEQVGEIAIKSQDGISPHDDTLRFARAIEAAHGIKEEA